MFLIHRQKIRHYSHCLQDFATVRRRKSVRYSRTYQELCFSHGSDIGHDSYIALSDLADFPQVTGDCRHSGGRGAGTYSSVLRIQTAPDIFKHIQQCLTMAAGLRRKPPVAPQKIDLLSL